MTIEVIRDLFHKANETSEAYYKREFEYARDTGKNSFWMTKEAKQLREVKKSTAREVYKAFDIYEQENHLLWEDEKWITKYRPTIADGMEKARQLLLNKLLKLPGVYEYNSDKGVKGIKVLTRNKEYYYQIHAYYIVVGEEYGACLYNECGSDEREMNYSERNKWEDICKLVKEGK